MTKSRISARPIGTRKKRCEVKGFNAAGHRYTAERAGLQQGDVFVSVDGHPIRSTLRLREVIDQTSGKPLDVVYSRNGQTHQISITPVKLENDGEKRWMIGVELEVREIVKLPFPQAAAESVRQNIQGARLIVKFLEGIVERRMSPKTLEGPIRIAQISGDAARRGPAMFTDLDGGGQP